uniref:AtpF n=1 Tax=Parascaris equorum TaxID=6256 RepID=A0A914RQ52_PAREQ
MNDSTEGGFISFGSWIISSKNGLFLDVFSFLITFEF